MNVFLTSFPHINPELLSFYIPVFTSYSALWCYINTKALCVFDFVKHLFKLLTGKDNVSESQAAAERSSAAPPVSVEGSFALDERLSLCHLNINLLPQPDRPGRFGSQVKWTCDSPSICQFVLYFVSSNIATRELASVIFLRKKSLFQWLNSDIENVLKYSILYNKKIKLTGTW